MPPGADLGELRRISNKTWAHSADDLGTMLSAPDNTKRLEPPTTPDSPIERLRKPSLNLRIEAYRNNLAQNQLAPSPSSYNRDFPSPVYSTGSASPLNARFPNASQETGFTMSSSDSSPAIGASTSTQSSIHNRSNSYNVLGSTTPTAPQGAPSPRHKASSSGNIPNFSFTFGGKPSIPTRSKVESNPDNRRASQVIYHSGFLNRNVSTAFPMNLGKNWKAYKAEIKGSKLYLFKPPSEKAAAVRDLFATEHGLEVLEEAEGLDGRSAAESEGVNSQQPQEQKRRRLFWGPGRHPEMLLDPEGTAIGGTLEALVYELVFAATFPTDDEQQWKGFGESVLLCLPALIGHDKFEADLIAVIDRYIRYTESEAVQKYRRRRVEWLISTYIEYHHAGGVPLNLEAFVKSFSLEMTTRASFSANAFRLPKPPLATPRTPSERSSLAPKSSFSREAADGTHGGSYADLRIKGTLSRERTITIDTNILAQSLELLFLRLASDASQVAQAQPIIASLGPTGAWPVFTATELRPHWLTHFIVAQIVAPSDGSVSISSTHSRALVISKWTRVADHARLAGNECMWKAILDALTSKPIARLVKMWRKVDTTDRLNVESWIKGESGIKKSAQNPIPWLNLPAAELAREAQGLKVSPTRRDKSVSNTFGVGNVFISAQSYATHAQHHSVRLIHAADV
jgi:GTPase-activating protein BEM2